MLILFATLLTALAFLVLLRLWWLSVRPAARASAAGPQRYPRGGPLSRAEAAEILGLDLTPDGGPPDRESILAAHRRLIQRVHPDRGGSAYLARQLNEAKERLLADSARGPRGA